MEAVESSIVVDAPVAAVYERWLHFEEYPQFMIGLVEVRKIEDKRFAWKWKFQGNQKESVAEITLQIPQQRIAWRSISGAENSGVVSFETVEERKTMITMSLKYDPAGEWDSAEAMSGRLRSNLENFKGLLEASAIEDIVEKNWQGF